MPAIPAACPFAFCPHTQPPRAKYWRDVVYGALQENRVALDYQWIVTRSGPRIYEALARITDEDRAVPAGRWIEAVVNSPELSQAFDWHVLNLALSQCQPKRQTWINCTLHTIKSPDFVPRFAALLEKYDVNPAQIALEATEQAAGNGVSENLKALHRDCGVRIVVDDFGSGYSNLAAIAQLPLYAIKIDGAIVTNYRDSRTADLIRLVADLAQRWGVLCVAEWVETPQQSETLQSWGVAGLQGWLFGRPGVLG